jgi:hypothetical protein
MPATLANFSRASGVRVFSSKPTSTPEKFKISPRTESRIHTPRPVEMAQPVSTPSRSDLHKARSKSNVGIPPYHWAQARAATTEQRSPRANNFINFSMDPLSIFGRSSPREKGTKSDISRFEADILQSCCCQTTLISRAFYRVDVKICTKASEQGVCSQWLSSRKLSAPV